MWNIKMKISRTEEGSRFDDGLGEKDGRIKMTIEAYDSTNMTVSDRIDTKTVYLQVRRVTEVDIEENSISNKAGETITLHARASGIEGTDYFGQQQKTNNFDPIWDKDDKYKSPFELRWTLYYKDKNGKVTEKEIGEYPEYFSNVSYDAVKEGTKAGTQMITFKLNKALPKGAQLRATSLHAMGRVEGKGVQYNRSGLNYIRDIDRYKEQYPEGVVFDFIEITGGGRKELGGFKRANRQNWDLPGFEAGTIPAFKAKYFNQNNFEQYTFYRFREEGGVWTQYYKTDDNENYHAYVTGSKMGRLFRTDKAYDLDVVNVLYNTSEKKIYWPQDSTLVEEAGTGWHEAGYTLKEWDYDSRLTAEEKSFESKQEYYIPKTEMWVGPKEGYKTIEKLTHDPISSETSPIQVKGGGLTDGSRGEQFAVVMEPTAFDLPAAYANFTAILEKKTASGWVPIETNNMQQNEKWNLRTQNPEIMAEATYGARGLYKISSVVNNMDWVDVSGDMFNPKYTTSYETLPLYEENGAGIIYLEFVE